MTRHEPASMPPLPPSFTMLSLPKRSTLPRAAGGGSTDRISRDALREAAQRQEGIAMAHDEARAIVDAARAQAQALRAEAQAELDRRADAMAQHWQSLYDEREAQVLPALVQGIQVIVDSVLRSVLLTDPGTQAQAAVNLAARLLDSQMRASLRCHPSDLAAIEASPVIGNTTVRTDPDAQRGVVEYLAGVGEVRVDGKRFIDVLLADLRACFPWAGATRPANPAIPVNPAKEPAP